MNMKPLLKIICVTIFAATLLHSCNNDVFISNFAPSVNEVRLSENDSVSDISFEASNWDVMYVYFMDSNGFTSEIRGNIYDNNGNLIAEDSQLSFSDEKLVKMTISHPELKLNIERKDGNHLVLSGPENMDYETKRIYIDVGNMYYREQISVNIESSSRYNLDSIVYKLNPYSFKKEAYKEKKVLNFMNLTNNVSTFDIYPFKNFTIDYHFVNYHEWEDVLTEDNLKIFGKNPPIVNVPVIGKYEVPIMSEVTFPLSASVNSLVLPDEMLEIKEIINVSPLKQNICAIECVYDYYGINFRIYASHPVTGKKRILKGLLDIYIPQSYTIEYGQETDVNIVS